MHISVTRQEVNQLFIYKSHTYIIFENMKWFEFDNPAFKIKVLDYTYSSEPSINTALPVKKSVLKTILFYVGVILTFGFLWLLTKWSAKKKVIFKTNICSLQQSSHFLIHDEDTEGQLTLVKRQDKFEIRMKRNCVSFLYHDRTYIYIQQKQVFVPVRYEELGHHLDRLKKDRFYPFSEPKRQELLNYYGENVMKLPIQSRIDIFIQQMLTPYQVFQTYGIMLWIYEEYYLFSFILIFYSIYTYWTNSSEIRNNQQKLAFESYFDVQTKILVNEGQESVESEDQRKQEVQLCKHALKIDEHKSEIMKDNFNGIESAEQQEMTIVKKRETRKFSKQVRNEENNLINNKNIRFKSISSHKLIPGDIIILNELDIVPCDCILLRGEALVNQKYSTGENYLVRKEEIQNFTYVKENERSFVLNLGTEIVKIKNNQFKRKHKNDNDLESIESSMQNDEKIDSINEIVCLVTQTNFNTLRGKYLRAIRYQNKQQEQFFKETIYFIYIIIFITSIVYFIYLAVIGPYTKELRMFLIYIDLLITAIPPTLPTILNVGIQFVTRRLKAHGISSVMTKSVLTGGKVDTIILKGEEVFGRQFSIQSAAIGIKGDRGFGLTFSSVNQFESYNESQAISYVDVADLNKKKTQKSQFYKIGTYFINALACCHTLQFFRKEIEGSSFDKKIFEFSQGVNLGQDEFETLNQRICVQKIIRFKSKNMKLGVLVTIIEKAQPENYKYHSVQNEITVKRLSIQCEQDSQLQRNRPNQYHYNSKRVIFIKGSAEKILNNCLKSSYPENAFDYIVDMAEKGFILYCYAMKEFPQLPKQNFDYQQYINHNQFIFLGFIILEQIKSEENLEAIKALNQSQVKLMFISEQRELEATSRAISNGICNKNELILCNISKSRDKIFCKGHIEWESTSHELLSQFITEFQEFGKNSKVSISSDLYEEIFIKRQMEAANNLLEKCIIFNKMQLKHEKNLHNQLERRKRISCGVGKSGSLSQSSNLSIELQRQQSALLSSFYTTSSSLKTVVNCLRICRAGLSTNFHGFSMMILFSLIQFTTVILLNLNYESLTNDQSLYEDLFITFPIFITLNLTQPASKLSKELPPNSFFSLRHVISMSGQLLIQFLAQFGFIMYVLSLASYKADRDESKQHYILNGQFRNGSDISLALFVLSNNLYLGIVLSTSVSKPFRKPFYTNPFYTINLILLWCYNTFLVIFPNLSPTEMRSKNLNAESQFILVVALLMGNLMMVVMYMFENLLVFLWSKENPCLKRNSGAEYSMDEAIR